MSTTREQILQALKTLMDGSGFFPPAELDAPEPTNPRFPIPGETAAIKDHAAVQDGPVRITRDGGGQDDFELELEAALVYAVIGADSPARRARRDAGAAQIEAIIAASHDLGLGDPQIYAGISDAARDDKVPVLNGEAAALLNVTVLVQYIAASAAG